MKREQALNMAIGCVMTSYLGNKEKTEVLEALSSMESYIGELETANLAQHNMIENLDGYGEIR